MTLQESSGTSRSLLRIHSVTVEYQAGRLVRALDDASLDIPLIGYTLGLVGESGSGKTTLGLSVLNAIERPGRITSGRIEYMGKNVLEMGKNELRDYRWKEVSMVYQSAMNSLNPVKKVSDHIVEVLREHTTISKADAREKSVGLLSEVGISPNRANDYPHEFSGGMRQRVVIALALALSPKVLIADEPTSALDVVIQRQTVSLLKREVAKRNLSLIFITHEISLLVGLVQDVAVMYRGEIVERGPLDRVLKEPLHPYTEMLLSNLLTLDSDVSIADSRQRGDEQKKEVSFELNRCKYAHRCKYAFDRCLRERPLLAEFEKGRLVACHKYG